MMKKWMLGAAMFCVAHTASAEDVTVPAVGYGDTFEQAVESALGNAIKQVNGAAVATRSASPKAYVQVKRDAEGQASAELDAKRTEQNTDSGLIKDTVTNNEQTLNASASAQAQASSKTTVEAGVGSTNDVRAQGKVKGYSVTKQECGGSKGCMVELSVTIEKFEYQAKSPKLERDSIAIVTTGKLRRSALSADMRQSVTDKLVKSGRFTVLDRSNDAAFEKENDFLSSDNVSDQQRARLGQAAGADFLLIIDLTQASVSTRVQENNVELTGESTREVSQATRASVRYTLVEAATRAVKWSDSASFASGGNKISAAMEQFQGKMVGDIIEIVNPAKVVAVQNGRVIINRGMGSVNEGQVYDIYATGEELVDPDTGEKLGATEEKVASIKIGEIKAKVAYGAVVNGQLESIAKGSIARMAAPPAQPAKKAPPKRAAPPKSDQKIDSAGGVIL
ncbi:CsgG/HfaB family protein [Achromobacter xylosoxidans]|uniref:CsgG/HfaB family protein n=1 Tax=Alcaligenes xylosoxydans xylosoxydans TaxID=85698 RepID=UPI001178259F|nr:CsgG/HfaB family protein [Achromobacter xylosoxidans]